jgi:cobalt-zinc-cadmium efflux system protein
VAIGLNALIVVAEVVFGAIGHSVALIADAGHNLSDVLGLCAAFAASQLGRRAPSPRYTYGLGGTSILAALFNAVTLLVVTGALGWEAIQRFFHPEPVAAGLIMAVAAGAIVVNGVSAWLLTPGGDGDLNVRAAVAHLVADATVAAGVVVGALAIELTGQAWIDPALSLLINATIIYGTWGLLRESVALSLAAVPRAVRPDEVRAYLTALPGVAALHDLHIWPVSTSETAMTVHLVMPAGHPGDGFLMQACATLRERHQIGHATMQVETNLDSPCALAPDHVV